MSKIKIDDAGSLRVRDIVHAKLSTLDATATVADARAYFDASASRRQAFVVAADGRYVGSLTPDRLAAETDPTRPAAQIADPQPTISPDAPAATGRDMALQTDARRVAVVDDEGRLVGVVAVTGDLTSFCGTSSG